MRSYYVEFTLSAEHSLATPIAQALQECAEDIEITPLPQSDARREHNLKIHLSSADPTIVFDVCAQYGRIKSVKITESA